MISVLTPSIRPGGLDMVAKCLNRQTFEDWEWLVSAPFDPPAPAIQVGTTPVGNNNYALNRDWNLLYARAKGELIVNLVDLIWFPPDVLERFWYHYKNNPKAIVTTIGHQYSQVVNGKPENKVWNDPRARLDQGSFYQVYPNDVEMCMCSLPRQAIIDVNGLKSDFDKYAALSEKEMSYRMDKLGYNFWIDQSMEYRALHHERIGGEKKWNEAYEKGCVYYRECLQDIENGRNLKGDMLQYINKQISGKERADK